MSERGDLLGWSILLLLREPKSLLLSLVSRFGFAEFVVYDGEGEREVQFKQDVTRVEKTEPTHR